MAAPKVADSFGTFLSNLPTTQRRSGSSPPAPEVNRILTEDEAANRFAASIARLVASSPSPDRPSISEFVAAVVSAPRARAPGIERRRPGDLRAVLTPLVRETGPVPLTRLLEATRLGWHAFNSCIEDLGREGLVQISDNHVALTDHARQIGGLLVELVGDAPL